MGKKMVVAAGSTRHGAMRISRDDLRCSPLRAADDIVKTLTFGAEGDFDRWAVRDYATGDYILSWEVASVE